MTSLLVTVINVLTKMKSANITVILCQCMGVYFIIRYLQCRRQSCKYSCICGLGDHIATSGCWSLSESSGGTFFELVTVENHRFVVGISTLSIIVPVIMYFRFGRPHYYFRLSVVVAIIWEQTLSWARYGRKVRLHFVSAVATMLILGLICNINQHGHGISPV